ncbi:MAG: GntR family transcriptional regulator [Chloroflexota bacterium]
MKDGIMGRSMFQPADIRSLREMAYDDIRDAILSGALAPGQRVKERDVAEQMGISTTPVKEALRRLEQEGLVVSQPRRGAVVSTLVEIPVEEIEEMRGTLEAMAARLAATRMTDAELARLRKVMDDMTRLTLEMREPRTRLEDVSVFHQLIRDGSRNAFLSRFVETLLPFERVHRPEYLDPSEARRILAEHQAIAEALEARDPVLAEQRMADHFTVANAYWRSLAAADAKAAAEVAGVDGHGPAGAGTTA